MRVLNSAGEFFDQHSGIPNFHRACKDLLRKRASFHVFQHGVGLAVVLADFVHLDDQNMPQPCG